jgi:hypothetical protein
MSFSKAITIALLWSALASAVAHGQSTAPVVRDAVPAVLDLFEQYSIVALSEGPHNNQKGHEFRLALVRDPRFARLVNDVVVEFGNSRYQSVMDRFTAGTDVPYQELRQVWENTTVNGTLWDSPIYYEFFAAIREVNRANGSHIRILLGDPPIDWASIRSADQINAFYPQRGSHAATIVQQEVLSRNRRALLVFGEGHLLRSGPLGANTLVEILKRDPKTRIFTISNGYPDLSRFQAGAGWTVPSLIFVKGNEVGAAPSAADSPLDQDFDALLHLGGPSALLMTRVQKSVCNDAAYLQMRFERYALAATPTNLEPAAQLKKLCAN